MIKTILRAILNLALILGLFWGAGELLKQHDFASSIANREINIYLLVSIFSLFLVINFLSKVKMKKNFLPNTLSVVAIIILLATTCFAVLSEFGYFGKMAGDTIFFVLLTFSGVILLIYKFKLE